MPKDKDIARFAERLNLIKTAVSNLRAGPDRIRLELAMEELQSKHEHQHKDPALKWIKTLGALVIPLVAIWTLSQGIYEYGRTLNERERAPFLAAIANLSDPTSPAKRASALAALSDYSERHDFKKAEKGEYMSLGERTAMVLAFQLLEERSPALRAMIVSCIKDLVDDSSMKEIALTVLIISNLFLAEDFKLTANSEESVEIKRKLKSSAWAIGILMQAFPKNGKPYDSFDVSEFIGDRSLALVLDGADLSYLDLGDTDFSGADFSGSIVRGTNLSKATLDSLALRSLCSAQCVDQVKLNSEDQNALSQMRALGRPIGRIYAIEQKNDKK